MESIWLGRQDYADIDQKQKLRAPGLRSTKDIEIWGLEFNPVITLGKRGSEHQDLVSMGSIPVLHVDRGGQATLHSPGQLVIFPMMDLRAHEMGVKRFIETLLVTTQKTLKDYGISSRIDLEQAGIYTAQGKIAFVGLRIDQGVSRHGISINVSNDLELFKNIVPCGQPKGLIDRMTNHAPSVSCEEVYPLWLSHFRPKSS